MIETQSLKNVSRFARETLQVPASIYVFLAHVPVEPWPRRFASNIFLTIFGDKIKFKLFLRW